MNEKNSVKVKRLVGLAILTALVVVLQLLGNFVPNFGNGYALGLVPIAVGAILYGPLAGAFLGLVMGIIVATNPANYSAFTAVGLDVFKLLVVMFVKSTLAGLVSGYVYKLFASIARGRESKVSKYVWFVVAVATAAIIVPIINTSLYAILFGTFFGPLASEGGYSLAASMAEASEATGKVYNSAVTYLFAALIGINFVIELAISIVASPAIVVIIKAVSRNSDLGFKNEFSDLVEAKEDNDYSNNNSEVFKDLK